jgi:hypothetical protein
VALLFALAAQLADALTFVAGARAGVPLVDEANPLARALVPVAGLGGVVDLKLLGVAALFGMLALGERLLTARSARRYVLVGGALIGLAGLVAALVNVSAVLSLR